SSHIGEVVVRGGDESSVALLATEAAALEAIVASDVPGPRLLGVAMGGNTMWDHDRLTGIIDWECAGIGHPGIDLGMQRCDAALVVGLSGADAVLAGYESAIGHAAADVAYWDIAAALTTPGTMDSFVQIYAGQGRTDLDPPTLLARRDAFLAAALDRVR
ncbi:MAG TPA: phosphotransferase, partial [Ilumatobacteraceae bacterium]|nr:phosphotransferase [Ilumatobacteraceae bacterium]